MPKASLENQLENQLIEYPKIKSTYEFMNNNAFVKLLYVLATAGGMAAYNYKKDKDAGEPLEGLTSGFISLVCNMAIGYEYCLKSPFQATVILAEGREKPGNLFLIFLGIVASITLTAQLVHKQPPEWAIPIALSAFLNYFGTRISGLYAHQQTINEAAMTIAVTGIVLFPLVMIWLQDTAALFDSKDDSISNIIKDYINGELIDKKSYAIATGLFILGALGSAITLLFYGNAIKSIPGKISELYNTLRMCTKFLDGLLSFILVSGVGSLGYYSMDGFGVSIRNGLESGGEIDYLSSEFDSMIEFIIQFIVGLINTSAMIPAVTKVVEQYCSTRTIDDDSGELKKSLIQNEDKKVYQVNGAIIARDSPLYKSSSIDIEATEDYKLLKANDAEASESQRYIFSNFACVTM